MTWRKIASGAAALVLTIGCGDDGSSADPTGDPNTDTGATTTPDGSIGEDPMTGPSTDPGTTSTDPGTTDGDTSADDTGSETSGGVIPCEYPEGAVEPMAINEVLFPYSWPVALHADGTETSLELEQAPCGFNDVIDWSPHDVLVFVSIPAW